ncbi:MAG: VCBS repeat-containing protein [Candidatus Omnitrophica bacterium]|nr:VCBS repeat-containing protein [Candidatus Omnitrophota bacterium]
MQMNGGFRVRPNGQPVANSSKETAAQDITQSPGEINDAASKEAAAGQSGSSSPIPSISLPKGGGAIRGIGEKFAANPVTGTGSLSVPIATTPGRSGFGPQLSLSYDSGAGNGPFGFGWSLSLPSITRKTDKGLPKYQDADESDVFILSGAEDLVPVITEGNNVSDRTVDGVQYEIKQYRPRIEGLFARIERWTNATSGETHWRSISKDNITTLYGKTDESRIADLTDTNKIFSWLICESYDDKGNAIYYKYKAENPQNVDLSSVNERNRISKFPSTNRYLKRIKYGNKTPRLPNEDLSQRDDWMFEVVFDYGEHYTEDEQGQPTDVFINDDQCTWKVRQDPFSAYRAGFEVRTYRLCQRVLMFHHFPDELGTDDYLVRSTEFAYNESTLASFITKIIQSGYVRTGTYLKKSLPPLEFEYSQVAIQEEIKEIDSESLENLPYGLDGMSYRWVDLDGEGLSGILTEQADTWFYKPNQGGGKFGALQLLAEKPSLANLSSQRQQLMDLAGDGQLDLVELSGTVPGFYERTNDKHWKQFTPFISLPNIDWNDPNLKFVDLTGDGHADILITEDQAFTWYPSLAEAGFSPNEKVYQALDEETGPRLVFADGTQSVYLADLSGDGLTDLARIRNGEVCYWPNLGYGRFGAKVTMDNSPLFDYPDQFNQQRIRLADIDGSGTTDIIYLGRNGVHIYFNQSGNKWSEVRTLTQFPHVDNLSSVMVADLMGNGTACLVWSSPLPGNAQQQMRYIDLMGGQKPHLLVSSKNNMGAQTRVHYAASTKFYLEDLKAGKPWITRIPFPVHVVERVETYDHISRNRFATHYAYHHGYFDGIEREFRGFGMVEQWDTEEIGTDSFEISEEDTNWEEASFAPPVLTRTWFHTGAFLEGDLISKQFADEYYREGDPSLGIGELDPGQFSAMLLDDTVLPEDLTVEEIREACRALKGGILRQEVYALDRQPDGRLSEESDRPYTVSERNYTIKQLQPRGDNKHAVFFVHPLETIDFHYERKLVDVGVKKLADPRVSHQMTLKVDDYGNVERSVAIGYPRRAVPGRQPEQEETHITFTVNRFINYPNNQDWYRAGLPAETQTYEIVKPPKPAVSATSVALFKIETFRTLTENLFPLDSNEPDTLTILPYEKWNWRKDTDTSNETKLRLIERVRTLYRKNDLSGFSALGQVDSLALPGETYKLAFTPGLLETVYIRERLGEDLENLLFPDPSVVLGSKEPDGGGYVDLDGNGNWWIPSGQIFYWQNLEDNPVQERDFAREHFFLPHRFSDPFGNNTVIAYDSDEIDPQKNYNLLLTETRDPLDNTVSAQNNYRVLQPALITDPNGAVSESLFDVLGMVVATAIHKGDIGDSLQGVQADLTQQQIDDFFANPGGQAVERLGTATTCIIYDVDRYYLTGNPDRPPFAATIARETHVSGPVPAGGLKVQISFSYSDGFEREIQTKIPAEPGAVEDGGPIVDPRWVGTGWTIFNNKGKPVRQYEPFFDDSHDFRYGKEIGVSPILFYDPIQRVVATLHPNNTYEKVVFDPWHQESYDVNDTLISDPRTDTDISGYVEKYFTSQPDDWKTWLQQRGVDPLDPPQDVPGLDPEKKAAVRTLPHANTPTIAFLDSLGRPFLTVAHNRFERRTNGAVAIIEEKYSTRVVLDIEGNQREVMDAKDRIVMRYDYDMLGSRIHQASMEAGERWTLNDVGGSPICAWDSRGHALTMEYDALRRPTQRSVEGTDPVHSDPRTVGNPNPILYEKVVYGEDYAGGREAAAEQNLLTRAWKQFDSAGVVTNETCDFKGNLLRSSRRLVRDYKTAPDWKKFPEPEVRPDDWEEELFLSSTRYDALNRPIQLVAPHAGSETDVIQPGYNEANLLEKLDVWLKHAGEPAELLRPDTADEHFVTNIDYNARGQRTLIQYGNDAETRYHYDPATFRLTHLYTRRDISYNEDCGDEPINYPAPETPPQNTPCGLQNLHYTYDPAGNITSIRDDAQHIIYFNGEVVRPDAEYKYDAIYRLIEARGREHIGQASEPQATWHDSNRINLAHPNDGQAMRNYFEFYKYDEVGNILKFDHKAKRGNWTRAYEYDEPSLIELEKNSNRLSRTVVHPNANHPVSEPYAYDPHGNMTSMPHLPEMAWDFKDQMQMVDKGGGCMAYYVYDAGGQRVRKVIEQNGRRMNERFYLGGFEVYRKYNGGDSDVTLERETLHVMDDQQRIAMVKTRTQGDDHSLPQLIRYQLGNHLGSASLELDWEAQVISYEEYYPYGSTSYQAVRSQTETPKRYRYTGMERDEETGLNYHGARYYAPWLGLWTSCDPEPLTITERGSDKYASNSGTSILSSPLLPSSSAWNHDMQPLPDMAVSQSFHRAKDQSVLQKSNHHRGSKPPIHSKMENNGFYRYAANNPIRYVDPEGAEIVVSPHEITLGDLGAVYLFHRDVRVQVQAELQRLDPSARVNMTNGHVYFDTSVSFQGHERGHALLQRLVQSQHRVEINQTGGQNETIPTDREAASDPNTGSGSIISLNPTCRVPIPVYIQGQVEFQDSPLHITLGHELIHADQMRRGRYTLSQYRLFAGTPLLESLPLWGQLPPRTMPYRSLSGEYLHARIDEVRDVGLTDLPSYIVTENQLRQESGLPPRDRYVQFSWQ